MKFYIRYFEKPHWLNWALKGMVFIPNRKFGFYYTKYNPTIYLKEFAKTVSDISIVNSITGKPVDLTEKYYYQLNNYDIIKINYKNGTSKTVHLYCNYANGYFTFFEEG